MNKTVWQPHTIKAVVISAVRFPFETTAPALNKSEASTFVWSTTKGLKQNTDAHLSFDAREQGREEDGHITDIKINTK